MSSYLDTLLFRNCGRVAVVLLLYFISRRPQSSQ